MWTVLKQTHLWTSWIRTSWCLQFIGPFIWCMQYGLFSCPRVRNDNKQTNFPNQSTFKLNLLSHLQLKIVLS